MECVCDPVPAGFPGAGLERELDVEVGDGERAGARDDPADLGQGLAESLEGLRGELAGGYREDIVDVAAVVEEVARAERVAVDLVEVYVC